MQKHVISLVHFYRRILVYVNVGVVICAQAQAKPLPMCTHSQSYNHPTCSHLLSLGYAIAMGFAYRTIDARFCSW